MYCLLTPHCASGARSVTGNPEKKLYELNSNVYSCKSSLFLAPELPRKDGEKQNFPIDGPPLSNSGGGMNSQETPSVLTVDEAAQYLRLSKTTLNRLRVTGKGPSYVQILARGRVTYRHTDLDAWLDQHTMRSTSEIS
ncbi:helix-turn-helix transcriptional regulator [Pararhizobium sp.]|uniref:helix-turn-helix transcriptional regulator n=1 Tax=Pararhizobium sp. TaxID=1977563 RepID=UPI002D7E64DF|nr:helix-turn-helix domain-containing protein [Pararhizobium sp.]